MSEELLTFDCLIIKQFEYTLYGFSASARLLWNILEINQRQEDKDEGYQRALSSSRVQVIANYINNGNPIPNSILVAFDERAARVLPDKRQLQVKNLPKAGWVIDGQHRLAGAKNASEEIDLFVIAFIGLDIDHQVRQFVTINKEAKGVPSSLYLDLLRYLPPQKSEMELAQERATDIADQLRQDENSPFLNRIVKTTAKKGTLSLNNFVRKLAPLVRNKGKFYVYSLEEQVRIINNFYSALEAVFPKEFEESRMTFFRTLGFGAVMNALPIIFDLSLKHYLGFQIGNITELLMRIDYFDFTPWDQYGSGNQAETSAGEELQNELLSIFEKVPESGALKL